jgi:hypothetical protein
VGDCNRDGVVTVHELVSMINIALDRTSFDACPRYEDWICTGICVNVIVEGVNNLLRGCP